MSIRHIELNNKLKQKGQNGLYNVEYDREAIKEYYKEVFLVKYDRQSSQYERIKKLF